MAEARLGLVRMGKYHGIIIDISQKDNPVLDNLKILSKKKTENWILYKIEVKAKELNKTIKELQENMVEGKFYFHFYRNNELIIIFKNKIFEVNVNKSSWTKAINYGKNLGIPREQLDFYPYKIEDEEF